MVGGDSGAGFQWVQNLPASTIMTGSEALVRQWSEVSAGRDWGWLIELHARVRASGVFNFQGLRVKVPSAVKVEYLRHRLQNYPDKIICDFLEFGWPIGFQGRELPISKLQNHSGAKLFQNAIDKYISKELGFGAILGPFSSNPFRIPVAVSPLNSVPKNEGRERRVILDLSFPAGGSVNEGISKEEYLGVEIKLTYPSVDNLAKLIGRRGRGCFLYKRDLRRAYRQFPVDPGDIHLLGFSWRGKLFVDRVLAMGLRSAAMMCQRVTSGIAYLQKQDGYELVNFLDDFGGCETQEKAQEASDNLGAILKDAGLEEAKDKEWRPAQVMEFLGVLFNTLTLTMEVTPDRLVEINEILRLWQGKRVASKRELQSLIGKLIFVAKCVVPGRLFISRMLEQLRKLGQGHHKFRLSGEFRKDLAWWRAFMGVYNGVSVIPEQVWSYPDASLATDACPSGCGGHCGEEFFHTRFPVSILNQALHINALECLGVIVAVKMWGRRLSGLKIRLYCDNMVTVSVINSGKARDSFLLSCLRELCFWCARYECCVRAVHLAGVTNRKADCLSRWHLSPSHARQFFQLCRGQDLKEVKAGEELFQFAHDY